MTTRLATAARAPEAIAAAWLADYRNRVPRGDVASAGGAPWTTMLTHVAASADGDLAALKQRAHRHAHDIGTSFRIAGERDERRWPLSPLPLLIDERTWSGIAAGIAQRAQLMELLLADIYGAQRLIGNGLVPAALLNGSPNFLRPMVGLPPPGGHHLHVVAADIARGPSGEWRVLADHTRTPIGAGYALENRLALSRVLPGLQGALNIRRLAPFFADLRAGIAAACHRAEPRIALLTPGRLNPSYAEQAHLARYLGLLLVEGEDLATHDDRIYLRTIEGLKRVDALWRRVDSRMIDPLAFDSRSQIGVAGLVDAIAAGNVVVANAPGSGVLESAAFAAFLPRLSVRLTGEDLLIPNIATWWCGQDSERARVVADIDRMAIAPAFPTGPRGLGGTAARLGSSLTPEAKAGLLRDMERRGIDYVGQEVVRLSTLPTVGEGGLEPRPFTVRVFAARDAAGQWQVMAGGFARIGAGVDPRAPMIGEGASSTDVAIISASSVAPVTLLPGSGAVALRRNPGTLPSRVADNFFWLGRYLERAEAVLALVRAALGGAIDVSGGAAPGMLASQRLVAALIGIGAVPPGAQDPASAVLAALDDADQPASVRRLLQLAREIGEGARERLSADVCRLLDRPLVDDGPPVSRSAAVAERLSAIAGMSAEHMGRTASWRFLDLGRRIERAVTVCRHLRAFGSADASADELSILLELADSAIGYRQRYSTGVAVLPVRDLVALDASNPRSLAFQVEAIVAHLNALPRLSDDGMSEVQQVQASALAAVLVTQTAATLEAEVVQAIEHRLLALSEAVARRFFLRGSEPLRGAGLTLA